MATVDGWAWKSLYIMNNGKEAEVLEVEQMDIAEALMTADNYRKATLDIERINAEIQNKQAQIASKRELELANLKAIQSECKAQLEAYVLENKDDLLGDSRSSKFAGITIGFRKATAKLKTVGKATWDTVLTKLKANSDWKDDFVKSKEECDKTALKQADKATLKKLGLTIEQPDNFFVKV